MPSNYYGTTADALAYHIARDMGGVWGGISDPEQALQRGSDYIDARYREQLASGRWVSMFAGRRAGGRDQQREWPRVGASDYEGNDIASDEDPIEVIHATFEAAILEGATPGILSPGYVPSEQVTQETVGPVTVKYADSAKSGSTPNRPVYPYIDELIAPVLVTRFDMPVIRVV
jgi:hypothetical protein